MYPIAHLIYGVPLTDALAQEIQRMEADPDAGWFEEGQATCGFVQVYSGVAPRMVGYCGVSLAEFPCLVDPVSITDLSEPTPEQRRLAEAAVEALMPNLRALCPPIGVHLVFGTS